jgi:hypothetical protein
LTRNHHDSPSPSNHSISAWPHRHIRRHPDSARRKTRKIQRFIFIKLLGNRKFTDNCCHTVIEKESHIFERLILLHPPPPTVMQPPAVYFASQAQLHITTTTTITDTIEVTPKVEPK